MTSKKVLAYDIEPNSVKYRLRLARYPALAKTIASKVNQRQQDKLKLLDIGVGYGRVYRYVRAQGVDESIDWHGIDLRRVPSDTLAGAGKYDIKLADVEEGLPYDDGIFDIIVAEQILEHLDNPANAIREIYRVAAPNALIVIGVPIFPGWFTYLRNLYIRKLPETFEKSGSGHVQTFSLKSIRHLLLRGGLVAEEKVCGFRVFSGGILRPLENYRWWYRFQGWLGQTMTPLAAEVQFTIKRLS